MSLSSPHHPMRSLGKILLALIITISSIPFAFAQQTPDMFTVEISPNNFDVNTPVDVTISAVKANGDIIKDYQWDVFIDVNGTLDTADYTVPSEWLYSFLAQDQWVKTFSKWLLIKKAGSFTVTASDISEDTIKWEKDIIVGWGDWHGSEWWDKTISISSPSNDSIVKSDVAEIIWSGSIKNSPFEIFLNDSSAYQGTTDENWGFVGYVNGLNDGKNTIQARISDINDTVIAESKAIEFSYDPATDSTFNSIQVLPGNTVKAWDKVTFSVKTSAAVTSATIKLSNGRSAPMDAESDGVFTKELTVDTEWKLNVSLDISTNWTSKSYNNISMLIVEAWTTIGKVRIFSDSVYKNKVTLTWDVEWVDSPKYLVSYGIAADNLDQSKTVNTKELILETLTPWTKYYFKITPVDANWKITGTASEVANTTVGDDSALSCTVQWIKVNDVIVGSAHLLTRSGVANVEKYIIYRSEEKTDIEHMQKVTELTGTQFEYPFNPNAKAEKYSYYAVQAICTDGKTIVLDDVKKVKTWPVENILLFIFVSLFFYGSYRLYGYNKM